MTSGRRAAGTTQSRDDESRLAALLKEASRIMVFTGAGVSTASGIPDFRGPNGVGRAGSRSTTTTFWHRRRHGSTTGTTSLETWAIYSRCAAERRSFNAIVALEGAGKVAAVVTQNVDGLHVAAGRH